MAARKRSQEEKTLRTLREQITNNPANKQCFDCHQRGPTYVNMTIGSFVCTSCSGMLRGLNPPHRVKSITMTVFTPEEIEFIRNKGNEYCRYVWLGTYDTRSLQMEPEPRDEQKVKDFMIQKYERKRWYVDPDKAVRNMQDHILEDHSHHSGLQSTTSSSGPSSQSSTPQSEHMPETKPLSNLLGRNAPHLVVHNSPAPLASSNSWVNPNTLTNTRQNMAQEKSVDSLFGSPDFFGTPSTNQVSNAGILDTSQSISQIANSVSYSIANGNFANFENAFNDSATTTSKSFGMFSPVSSSSASSTFSSNAFENVTSPPSTIASPIQPANQPQPAHPPSADRYAALADLDSLFHQEPTQSVTPPAPVSSWVATNTTVTLTNNNNNSSSLFGNPQQQNSMFSAATANPFTSTTSTWSSANNGVNPNQAAFPANPFQQQAPVVNPTQQSVGFGQFGLNNQPKVLTGPVIDNYTNYSQIPPANMQQVYFNNTQGLIGSPNGIPSPQYQQNGGLAYHWAGNAPNQVTSNNLWGIGSSPDAIRGVLQNPKMNNSGLGPQSIQTPANPFMSNAVSNAPRSNPSNPFL